MHRVLRTFHAASDHPNGPPLTLEQVRAEAEAHGTEFYVTSDFHNRESLAFVRGLGADLGVIYGTRILKPRLYTIPERGSINIHKHKVPDYRGSGAPGLWEMRDGVDTQTITVHRVLKAVDAGAVLGTRTFPIERFDTLASVGLKADILSVDCLVEVIAAESANCVSETPQTEQGHVYKGFEPHEIWTIEQEIRRRRPEYRVKSGRPLPKLVARLAMYPRLRARNLARRREGRFPVTILFHHLITDRPKFMGLPTDHFLRHVQYLRRHYRLASLPDALAMLESGSVEEPTVVLTFDDGYADNFLALRSVVEVEQVPVTLFISTEHISTGRPFQHDVDRKEMDFPPLDWDQVRYLDRHGVTIGSHTRTHFDCGATDAERLHHEIVGALEDLRRELGHDIPYFSFPKGFPKNMSEPAVCLAMETYPYVFSAHGGANVPAMKPQSVIRRSSHPDSLLELELTCQGLLDFHTDVYGP